MSLQEYQERRQSEFLSSAANALTTKQITPREVWILIRTLVLDGVLDERYSSDVPSGNVPSSSLKAEVEEEIRGGGDEEGKDWELYLAPRQPHTGVTPRPAPCGHRWKYSMAVGKNVLRHFSAVPHLPHASRPASFSPAFSSASPTWMDLEEAAAARGVARKRARMSEDALANRNTNATEENALLASTAHQDEAGADPLDPGQDALLCKRQWLHHLIWCALQEREGMMPSPLSERWATMKNRVEEEREESTETNPTRGGGALAGGGKERDAVPHCDPTSEQEGEDREGEVHRGGGDDLEWFYMGAVGYPCLGCPLLSSCSEGGVVNPTDCVYLHDWMK